MRGIAVAATVALLAVAGACDDSATVAAQHKQKVLLFAPGGFGWRQPIGFARRAVRAAGMRPVVARYPVNDMYGAVKYARALARQNPGAHALGFSAGGALAAGLAARNLVDRAVTVNAPSNLRRLDLGNYWEDVVGADRRERWRSSPTRMFRRNGPHRHTLVIQSRDDELVPFDQAQELAALSGGRLRTMAGTHGDFENAMPRALRYLAKLNRVRR